MTKLLKAQSAQLAGDTQSAVAAYNQMLDHHETHGLGLRGLHLEARRADDHEAALQYAMRANARAPAAWAGQAVLDDRTRRGDWAGALATVDTERRRPPHRQADREPLARGDQDRDGRSGDGARSEARARAGAGSLPAGAGARAGGHHLWPSDRASGRLSPRKPHSRGAYAQTPHPDLAAAYLRVRHGDFGRTTGGARSCARPGRPGRSQSLLTVGRAALEARDSAAARAAIAPLIASDSQSGLPTRRICLLMADIEEADDQHGAVREWLGRAARAPRDKAWVADGVISDRWAPVSPSGALDAFVWRTPDERIAAAPAEPAAPEPMPVVEAIAAPAPTPALAAAPTQVPPPSPRPAPG